MFIKRPEFITACVVFLAWLLGIACGISLVRGNTYRTIREIEARQDRLEQKCLDLLPVEFKTAPKDQIIYEEYCPTN